VPLTSDGGETLKHCSAGHSVAHEHIVPPKVVQIISRTTDLIITNVPPNQLPYGTDNQEIITSNHIPVLRLANSPHLVLRNHIFNRLVRKLQVFLERHSILNFPEHDRRSDEQARGKQNPVRDE